MEDKKTVAIVMFGFGLILGLVVSLYEQFKKKGNNEIFSK